MSLIGVCLDAGPGVSIVMPFMANGSLLEYLKKERDKIYLPDTSELEDVSIANFVDNILSLPLYYTLVSILTNY